MRSKQRHVQALAVLLLLVASSEGFVSQQRECHFDKTALFAQNAGAGNPATTPALRIAYGSTLPTIASMPVPRPPVPQVVVPPEAKAEVPEAQAEEKKGGLDYGALNNLAFEAAVSLSTGDYVVATKPMTEAKESLAESVAKVETPGLDPAEIERIQQEERARLDAVVQAFYENLQQEQAQLSQVDVPSSTVPFSNGVAGQKVSYNAGRVGPQRVIFHDSQYHPSEQTTTKAVPFSNSVVRKMAPQSAIPQEDVPQQPQPTGFFQRYNRPYSEPKLPAMVAQQEEQVLQKETIQEFGAF
ncbi:expressed unknown protein [Seminavis robusta]|uniref:Uncharacterized protein n=1 Tax=Seminavis robusta TaxID=568900 RepID=A0A9N8HZI4_9STRA|nr:expressed unknown protein [Seminavis robusta]|eukprot:Sro3631_g349850.1 n/a (299) ;mRNA; f:1736-2632